MEIGEIIGYVASAVGGGGIMQVINWRLNKKKGQVEIQADEIENIRKSVEVYQTIISDQNKRINELTVEVQQLRTEKRQMEEFYQQQIVALQKQIVEINRVLGINAQKTIRDKKTGRYIRADKA